jgi:hypothetical protein
MAVILVLTIPPGTGAYFSTAVHVDRTPPVVGGFTVAPAHPSVPGTMLKSDESDRAKSCGFAGKVTDELL